MEKTTEKKVINFKKGDRIAYRHTTIGINFGTVSYTPFDSDLIEPTELLSQLKERGEGWRVTKVYRFDANIGEWVCPCPPLLWLVAKGEE